MEVSFVSQVYYESGYESVKKHCPWMMVKFILPSCLTKNCLRNNLSTVLKKVIIQLNSKMKEIRKQFQMQGLNQWQKNADK